MTHTGKKEDQSVPKRARIKLIKYVSLLKITHVSATNHLTLMMAQEVISQCENFRSYNLDGSLYYKLRL
jgi:hypothetical protein